MKALITGIGGFVGGYLAQYLLEEGVEVSGILRGEASPLIEPFLHRLKIYRVNLLDALGVYQAVAEARPDFIFHLGAQASVSRSWEDPAGALTNNILGQLNLLEGVRKAGISPRIHIAGSSEEYGQVFPAELPIKETNPLRPLSPYGVSKVAQEVMAGQYFWSFGLKTVVTRAFNHEGPGRSDAFFLSGIARQLVEIEQGLKPPVIWLGDPSIKRDWSDVRDVVRAYWLSLTRGEAGEAYNVGSGVARSVEEVLDLLLGMSRARVEVRVDPGRLRPSDVPALVADVTKLQKATGWKPQIPLEQTLEEMLSYWRGRVAAKPRL